MQRRLALEILAGSALCPLCTRTLFAAGSHWSYEGSGGPGNWGALDAANRLCSNGTQESPLDITDVIDAPRAPLIVSWHRRPETIENNGHTIQLNFTKGNMLTVGERNYGLVQFHFHHPSEHLIRGAPFAMEAHFVHADEKDLAVMGVFMTPGRSNAVFNKIVSTMPAAEGPAPADPSIDPTGLLPPQRDYYRYEGSLTTPPCSETVDWFVFDKPIEVAQADIDRFARLYPMNARPVQPVNRRFVLRVPG